MELDQNDAPSLAVSDPEPQTPAADSGADQVAPPAGRDLTEPPPSIRPDGRPRTRVYVGYVPPDSDGQSSAPPPERPGYAERARLNAADSFYRGTLLGAFELNRLYRLSHLQDGEAETPDRKAEMEFYRWQYEKIANDLHAYDNMEGFANVSEAVVAFAGQFGASLLSPEAWLTPQLRGATLAIRAVKAGLAQAGLQLMTDPVTQRLSIDSRVQESYDPWRTGERAAMGFVAGGAIHAVKGAVASQPGPNPPTAGGRQSWTNRPRGPGPIPSAIADKPGLVDQKFISETLASLTDPNAVSRAEPFDRRKVVEGAIAKVDALIGYVRDVVKPQNGRTSIPRFTFDLGTPSEKVLSNLRNVDADIAAVAAQKIRLSNQVVDKAYRNNPGEADHLLSQLPKLLEDGEALRNKKGEPMRWILARPYETTSGSATNQVTVIEIARTNDAAEIVSIHVSPTRTLDQIRLDPWSR